MICECVALACLIAHGDISSINLDEFINKYEADDIIKKLNELHSEFFPIPTKVTITRPNDEQQAGEVQCDFKITGAITKTELLSLYGRCGEFLHRARLYSIERRPPYMPIDFGPIVDWINKLIRLLDNHMIFSKENDKYLVVILKAAETGLPVVLFAQAPPPEAREQQ
jgi:hypothetical protein